MSNLERTPTLTRSQECEPAAPEPVRELLAAREVDLGEGTPVRRLRCHAGRRRPAAAGQPAVPRGGPARLLLLGGEPFGEPLFMWWNLVAHSSEEIEQARSDWAAGRRFGEVRGFDGPRLEAPPLPPGRLRPRG